MLRTRLIASVQAMFNEFHGNSASPDWLVDMYARLTDTELAQALNNWRRHHPELYARHGVYVL